MIPQRTSQQPSAEQIQKQRDYLKQQQKLRLMASSTTQRTVSADTLINNLLEKKDTFKPADSLPSTLPSTSRERALENLKAPVVGNQQVAIEWLSPTSPNFPAVYRRVWIIVGQPDGLADTGKVFPLLLTSGLPTDVLGYIWGLVNRTVAGRLTEQELYSLLALVALAQRGYSFNSANVLSLVPQPPLPSLNLGAEPQAVNKMRREELNLQSQAQAIPMSQPAMPQLQSVQPLGTSVFQSDLVSDDFDDFAEFQSATSVTPNSSYTNDRRMPVQVSGLSQLPELQSIDLPEQLSSSTSVPIPTLDALITPEPLFVQKFPTVSVVGGRSIGSRLANHSLGAPKASKPKNHKHHHHHHHRSVPPTPPTIADDDFSDFQQASADEMFSKCSIKPPPIHTYLLKETAIRSEPPIIVEKDMNNPSGVASITTEIFSDISRVESKSSSKEHAKPEKGSELMGVEEDRYGALRALSFVSEASVEPVPSDNFEDFFSTSATTADDSFADITSRSAPSAQGLEVANDVPWGTTVADQAMTAEFRVDDWGNFESASNPVAIPQIDVKDSWDRNNLLMDELNSDMTDINPGCNNIVTPLQSGYAIKSTEISDSKNEKSNIPPISQISTRPSPVSNMISSNISPSDDDDFGDFVGPDAWVEEGKQLDGSLWTDEPKDVDTQSVGNLWLDDAKAMDDQLWLNDVGSKVSKEGVLDNHLVSSLWLEESKGDTQSVSSLELPGLDQAWDSVGEWRKCLQACVQVFQFAVDTFSAIVDPSILQEVMESSQGQGYLRDLVEVWSVCERIATSYRQRQLGNDHKLNSLLLSVESAWDLLRVHYTRAQIPREPSTMLEGQETCCICLVTGARLEFEGHCYHAPCANLWLHFVDTVLPVLQS